MESFDVILAFLRQVAANNNREWFAAHRAEYEEAHAAFEEMTQTLITHLAGVDAEVAHLRPKDCIYRIYRDTRFSEDKSPYKRHFGAFINSRGKSSYRGGYYLHVEPGASLLAGGSVCLPTDVLRAIRHSVVDEIDEFRRIVEADEFRRLFPVIGDERLKTVPKGFPRDFAYPEYIRPKDYFVSCPLEDDFFRRPDWAEAATERFRVMKPFMDFVNYTIDDF